MKKIYYTFFLLFAYIYAHSQQEVAQIQPTIMVIPFAKENEDLRTMLDSSVTTRVAIIKTQEAFDNRGFTTIDFRAKLKASKTDRVFEGLNQIDLKARLIEGSGADIYVEVEAAKQKGSSGNSVRLNLIGYDAFTGRLLGSKTISSPSVYTDKFDKLVEAALRKTEKGSTILMLEEFLNVMQEKFDDIVENGRAIKIIFGLDPGVAYNFNSEVGDEGDYLKDVIEYWFDDNAYKGNYHSMGATATKLIYDEVRIPLRDQNGRNLTPSKYARKIRKFCRTIDFYGDEVKAVDDVRGGTIYITFKNL